jgi:hypothetical protein
MLATDGNRKESFSLKICCFRFDKPFTVLALSMNQPTQTTFLPEKPLGVAMVICDRVIIEAGTGNKTLVSTFNTIHSQGFPCLHPRLSIYVSLTNGQGEKNVKLSLRDMNGHSHFDMGGPVRFENPNHVVELVFNIRNLPVPAPGVYSFEISADDEYVCEVKFNAAKQSEERNEQNS